MRERKEIIYVLWIIAAMILLKTSFIYIDEREEKIYIQKLEEFNNE